MRRFLRIFQRKYLSCTMQAAAQRPARPAPAAGGTLVPAVQPPPPISPAAFLYVILPYFNYCGFQRRRQLFDEFIARITQEPLVRVVVVEAVLKTPGDAPNAVALPPQTGIFAHYRYTTEHPIWIKESLINLAVSRLPPEWRYMAWIDADITFLKDSWVADTIAALQFYDIVQMFWKCENLGPDGVPMKIDRSFGYMYRESGKAYNPKGKYGFWHPGFAWAMTRVAYNRIGGLLDFAILGSADRHMALAWIGYGPGSAPGNIHPNYTAAIRAFQERCRGLMLGYLPIIIQHHFHGSLANRRYVERWEILTKNAYNPVEDIRKNEVGLVQLTESGRRLVPNLAEYFIGRCEDSALV